MSVGGEKPQACPCGNTAASVEHLGVERWLLRCRQCGLLARAQMPPEEELIQQYQEEYWAQYRFEQLDAARDNVFMHALHWLEQCHPGPGMIVDVGCGAGAFLAMCQKQGWKVVGFDPSPAAVAHAQALGIDAQVQTWPPCPLADESADAVTFINVLDHLRDPFAAPQEARRILRPGGLLYIRAPNGPVHMRLTQVLGAIGLGRLTVFHLYGFGRRAVQYHVPRLGFTVLAIQTAPPTQKDAYQETVSGMRLLRKGLKETDQVLYRVLGWVGLNRLPWGLSLEVMAVKAAPDMRKSEPPASPGRARGTVEDGASWRTEGGRVQPGASESLPRGARAPAEE